MPGDLRSDEGLHDAFTRLRRGDAQRAPAFETTLSGARARRARRRTARAGGAVAAIAVLALLVTARTIDRPTQDSVLVAELLASPGVWRGPTDFLLEGRRDPLWQSTEKLRETLNTQRIPQ